MLTGVLIAIRAILFSIIIVILVVLITLDSILNRLSVSNVVGVFILAPLTIRITLLTYRTCIGTSFAVNTVGVLVIALLFHILIEVLVSCPIKCSNTGPLYLLLI
jgi:hypothetical protein